MIVIICVKYKRNPSRTVDATERTRFSKSRSNDLEDIGQGQWSSHATHLLMLVVICTKYGKNPSGTVDATGRTQKVNGQTDRQTDRQTGWIQYTPPNFVAGGIITMGRKCSILQRNARMERICWYVLQNILNDWNYLYSHYHNVCIFVQSKLPFPNQRNQIT